MVRIGKALYKAVCPLCYNAYLLDRSKGELRETKTENSDFNPELEESEDNRKYLYSVTFYCPICEKDVNRLQYDGFTELTLWADSQIKWFEENCEQFDDDRDKIFYKEEK